MLLKHYRKVRLSTPRPGQIFEGDIDRLTRLDVARCFSKASIPGPAHNRNCPGRLQEGARATSPALMFGSGAALTSGGTRSVICRLRDLKTSRNNCQILAFNEAPGAQLVGGRR